MQYHSTYLFLAGQLTLILHGAEDPFYLVLDALAVALTADTNPPGN